MWNHVLAEQPNRFHDLVVRYRPELLHTHQVVQTGDLLNVLELLDAGIGTTADNRPIVDQVVHVDLVLRYVLGQVGAGALRYVAGALLYCGLELTVHGEKGVHVGHEGALRVLPRFLVGFSAMNHIEDGGAIVDVGTHRLRFLERVAINLDTPGDLIGIDHHHQSQKSKTKLAAQRVRVFVAGGEPQRRMRLLHRHRHHGALRDIEITPLPGKGAIFAFPHVHQDAQSLFPARAGLFRGDAEAAQFLDRGRAPGSDLDPALAENVQSRDSFRNAHWMVVWERQQDHRVSDPNLGGSLAQCSIENFGGRTMGKARLKVMLHAPEVGKTSLFRRRHLLEHLVKNLGLALAML